MLSQIVYFVRANGIVLLQFVCFGVMFTLWWYKGRDPDTGLSVAPMYEPPEGMTPAEAGTLVDDTIHPRDITCTLVDLAVRGYVKIEEKVETTLGIFHNKDYVFHLLKPREQWTNVAPHERVMLENVFVDGSETRLSALKNRFYTAVPVIRQDIMAALKNKGIYMLDPDSANGYSIVAVIGMGMLAGDGRAALAAAFYAAHHVLVKGALFLSIGVIAATGSRFIST